jgi:hypothetical protein
MPIISATPHPTLPYVRIDINWSDYANVEYARIIRTVVATGETAPLRPYVAFDGDYLLLSCGHGTFWDTEMPFDTPVTYHTEALDGPCTPNPVTCLPCTPVTVSVGPLTVASAGRFRLSDPVRPCRDQWVPLCFTSPVDPTCIPGQGIFFASMAEETEDTNSLTVNPANRRMPITAARERRGISSLLTVVTRTFADRDAVKLLTRPGSPLLWRGPATYGIADTYMEVGAVTVSRGLPDHKIQPRVMTLPFIAEDRPAGPSLGVCGVQVQDLCDTYATWNAMAAAGVTWEGLLFGQAGGLPLTNTWDDVLADYTDWDDVDNGTRDWYDVRDGV